MTDLDKQRWIKENEKPKKIEEISEQGTGNGKFKSVMYLKINALQIYVGLIVSTYLW